VKLPRDVHGTDAVKALHRLGYRTARQKGSHHILQNADGRIVVVPMHKPIKPGTLKGLIEMAGVSAEEFVAAL
jgi:predicted RNA binding protein YcfA (HicA-like mRNA interferase family)